MEQQRSCRPGRTCGSNRTDGSTRTSGNSWRHSGAHDPRFRHWTPAENGQAFQAALASIANASAVNPYIVQLDAGTYTLPVPSSPGVAALALPAFVSVKGAGMSSTFITSTATAFAYHSAESTGTVTNLSDFTVSASGGYAISIENMTTLVVDHVQPRAMPSLRHP